MESSSDGKNFAQIAHLSATGNGGYKYTDHIPLGNLTFYRLKMVDADGSFTYSKTISLEAPKSDFISLYPNPVIASATLVTNYNSKYIGSTVSLVDEWGRLLKQFILTGPHQQIDMDKFTSGLYYLKIKDGATFKIIKADK